jgi:dolichol-phosphate mannosyltransferase
MTWVPEYKTHELSPRRSDYAVVIPVINEGQRLHSLLGKMLALETQNNFDVIIVDGGSDDGSLEKEILEKYKVNTLLERVSPGKLGTQLQCAYHFCLERDYKGVITIDGNDKDDPEAITRMREKLEEGYDFVQGSRFIKGGHHENTPLSRLLAIRLIHAPLLSIASGFKWTDTTQGFRGYSHNLISSKTLNIFSPELSDYKLLFFISRNAPLLKLACQELPTRRSYPKGLQAPTKIRGLSGNMNVLLALMKVAAGRC